MSAQAIDILVLTVKAAGAIAADQFVDPAGAQAGADANTIGVARSQANAGDDLAVTTLGTAIVTAGGTLASGDPVSSDASGQAVKSDGATYTKTVARALQAAAAAGQPVECLLIPN